VRHPEILQDLSGGSPEPVLRYQITPLGGQRAAYLSGRFKAMCRPGYNGYDALAANRYYHGGCWAHARESP